jgi:hypothetical protein
MDLEVKAGPELTAEVVDWVCTQIETAVKDRAPLQTKWTKWNKQYEEILPDKKDFPWEGCSNLSVPETPTAVETEYEREVNVVLNNRPYIQVKPKKKGVDKENCSKIERFLDQVMVAVLDSYDKCSDWFLEKNKFGTSFMKVFWNFDERKVRRGDGYAKEVTDEARMEVVPIQDLIFPVNARDLQSCAFVAHRFYPDWNTLKRREAQGIYRDVEKVKNYKHTEAVEQPAGATTKKDQEEIEGIQRSAPDELSEYEAHEVYFDYDLDDDGYAESTVMTLHLESKTVLRWIHHPFDHGKRPFVPNKYMKRPGRVYAKGVCEILEHLTEAINTVYNQTIDNMTIANVKCFKGRKTARRDIGKLHPGKTFWVDDPVTDLMEFSMGEVHQSNFAVHQLLRGYVERRTKQSDYNFGRESSLARSRATATGTLALLQESGRHFDLVINNDRKAMVELAYMALELYLQYRPEKVFLVEGKGQDAFMMEEVELPTAMEIGALREEYDFYCAATSLAVNKEIEKQANVLLLQQLGSIYQQMIQLMMVLYSPQTQLPQELQAFVMEVIRAYYTMAKDLVLSFEKIDVESYLPELPQIVQDAYGQTPPMLAQLQQLLGGALGTGQPAGMAGLGEIGGMGAPQGGGGLPIAGLAPESAGGKPVGFP